MGIMHGLKCPYSAHHIYGMICHAMASCIAYARGHRIKWPYMVMIIHHSWRVCGELGTLDYVQRSLTSEFHSFE